MVRLFFITVMLAAVAVLAAGGKQGRAARADSVVYDQPTEWRLFSIDWPVHAFALQGNLLWCAAEPFVASVTMRSGKKVELQKMKSLGNMTADSITAIAVDKQGTVWFGGPTGAAQKNGSLITVYTAEKGLSGNKVTAIAAAKDGSVWLGTDNGADRYLDGTWKQYTVKEGLVSDKIQVILIDGKNRVWFGTDKGLSVYDENSWTTYTVKNGMSSNDIRALAYDRRKDMIWAAVGEKDVNCFDGQKWNVYMDIQEGITTIMVDSQSRIWFGSSAGLIKFNGDDWISDPKQLGVPASAVYQALCDEKGNMWFATETGVIYRANPYPF